MSGTEATDGTRGPSICAPDLDIASAIMMELLQFCGESLARFANCLICKYIHLLFICIALHCIGLYCIALDCIVGCC